MWGDYLIVLLIYISLTLVMGDVEYLFLYLLAMCMSSSEKCLFRFSDNILIRLLASFWCWTIVPCIFWILNKYQINNLQICSPIQLEFPILLIISFTVKKIFKSDIGPLVHFCFCLPCLKRDKKKMLLRLMSKSRFLMFSSRSSMLSGLHLSL